MKILYTIKEYAKLRGLTEIAIRKKVSSNYNEIIKIGKDTYILEDDAVVQKLKQNIKNKNAQVRELKLKLRVSEEQNNDKYLQELERQNAILEKKNKKLEKKIDKIQDKKDKLYEDILGTLVNQNRQLK